MKASRKRIQADNRVSAKITAQLRKERLKQGMQLQHAARKLGVSPGFLHDTETGRNRISADRLFDYLKVLKMDISDIWPSRR